MFCFAIYSDSADIEFIGEKMKDFVFWSSRNNEFVYWNNYEVNKLLRAMV